MEKISQNILGILGKHNIAGIYDNQEKLVYSFFENSYGEIYGIYEYENTRIIGYAIYLHPVPSDKKEQVIQYLSAIEQVKATEGFYIDRQTGCIAFGVDYHLDKESIENDMAIFEEFCMKPYTMFIQHQQPFYEIIKQ